MSAACCAGPSTIGPKPKPLRNRLVQQAPSEPLQRPPWIPVRRNCRSASDPKPSALRICEWWIQRSRYSRAIACQNGELGYG